MFTGGLQQIKGSLANPLSKISVTTSRKSNQSNSDIVIYKTVALGSRFSLMQSVHESNGCFWGFAALGNLVLKGSFTNYVLN